MNDLQKLETLRMKQGHGLASETWGPEDETSREGERSIL
jgi:hypothetical protein